MFCKIISKLFLHVSKAVRNVLSCYDPGCEAKDDSSTFTKNALLESKHE